MPVQLRSITGQVSKDVELQIRELVSAVNQLQAQTTTKERATDLTGELHALRAQFEEAVRRIDDLTRRVRALGG